MYRYIPFEHSHSDLTSQEPNDTNHDPIGSSSSIGWDLTGLISTPTIKLFHCRRETKSRALSSEDLLNREFNAIVKFKMA